MLPCVNYNIRVFPDANHRGHHGLLLNRVSRDFNQVVVARLVFGRIKLIPKLLHLALFLNYIALDGVRRFPRVKLLPLDKRIIKVV